MPLIQHPAESRKIGIFVGKVLGHYSKSGLQGFAVAASGAVSSPKLYHHGHQYTIRDYDTNIITILNGAKYDH